MDSAGHILIDAATLGPRNCDRLCCGCSLMVVVFNVNGITDDNFELYLNNELIATLPEADPDPVTCGVEQCRGHIIRPAGVTLQPSLVGISDCTTPISWQTHDAPQLSDATVCDLRLRLLSVFNNECNNYGLFLVYRIEADGLTLVYADQYSSPYPLDTTYGVKNPCCGGWENDCCAGTVPLSLKATFSNGTGTCSCLDGTEIELAYNDGVSFGFPGWMSLFIDMGALCGASAFDGNFLKFLCGSLVAGDFTLVLNSNNFDASSTSGTLVSCSPFEWTGVLTMPATSACGDGTNTTTVTIREV